MRDIMPSISFILRNALGLHHAVKQINCSKAKYISALENIEYVFN